jgi:hypothetical protein
MSILASNTWSREQPIYRGTGVADAIKGAGTAAIHKLAAALTVKETGKLRGKRELASLTKTIVHLTIHSSLARQGKNDIKNRFSATTPHES